MVWYYYISCQLFKLDKRMFFRHNFLLQDFFFTSMMFLAEMNSLGDIG